MKRQHKIVVLKYISGKLWLFIIPVLRSVFLNKLVIQNGMFNNYMDIIVISVVVLLVGAKWYFVKYRAAEKEFIVRKGSVFFTETVLPYTSVSCVLCHRPWLLKMVKAVKINLYSEEYFVAEKKKTTGISLIVSETDSSYICYKITSSNSDVKLHFNASKKELLTFSLLFSSALSGLIYIVTFVTQGSKVLGKEVEENIFPVIRKATEVVKIIPDDASLFSIFATTIFLMGWLVSLVKNLFRFLRLKITRCGNTITVENGCFSYWKYYVNYSRINYADQSQTLLMKLGKIVSVNVSCCGYEKDKKEMPVLVPITTIKRVASMLKLLLPDFTQSNITIRVKRTYFYAYVWLPVVLIVGIPASAMVLYNYFPEWGSAVAFLTVMFEIPSLYLLAVKLVAKFSTGIGVDCEVLTLSYCKGVRFHTVIVPQEKISHIKIRRTFFQRIGGCCDIIIYTRGKSQGHCIRGITINDLEILGTICGFVW